MTVKSVKMTLLVCSVLIFMTGCAAHQADFVDADFSGFLQDYSLLRPGSDGQALLVYEKPGISFKDYDKVMIDPVIIFYHEDAEYKGIEPNELKELTDAFNEELRKALTGYTIVDKPAANTLRMRIAITDIIPASPVTGTLTSLVPIGIVVSAGSKVATGEHTSVGQTAIELDVRDAMTSESLVAAVDRRAGKKGPFRGKYKDANEAFTYWGELIRMRLDEARGIETK